MPEDDIKVKEFEEKCKEKLFDRIRKIISEQAKIISNIQIVGEYVGGLERNLPNIGITLNNKLVELQHEFENAGLSIYFQNNGFLGGSFIGTAIIEDLIDLAANGIQNLSDYSKTERETKNKKSAKVRELEKASPLRRFFGTIKNFFVPLKIEDILYTDEEIDAMNTHLLEYKDTDNKLWNYNLKDNIIPSIVRRIRMQGYADYTVPGLLEESVIPDLQKLGLSDLIPKLQEAIAEEYKKDWTEQQIYQISEEDMNIGIGNLASIYATTEAADRQATINDIQDAVSPNHQGKNKQESTKDISLE
jgi:hypothetical protein